jgi:hypothetical protein
MQCTLYKIYFWNVFHMNYNLICIFLCTPSCANLSILVKSGCYIVDAASTGNIHCLGTTRWRGDVALRGSLIWCGALSGEVTRTTTVEAYVARGGSSSGWCRQVPHRRRWG